MHLRRALLRLLAGGLLGPLGERALLRQHRRLPLPLGRCLGFVGLVQALGGGDLRLQARRACCPGAHFGGSLSLRLGARRPLVSELNPTPLESLVERVPRRGRLLELLLETLHFGGQGGLVHLQRARDLLLRAHSLGRAGRRRLRRRRQSAGRRSGESSNELRLCGRAPRSFVEGVGHGSEGRREEVGIHLCLRAIAQGGSASRFEDIRRLRRRSGTRVDGAGEKLVQGAPVRRRKVRLERLKHGIGLWSRDGGAAKSLAGRRGAGAGRGEEEKRRIALAIALDGELHCVVERLGVGTERLVVGIAACVGNDILPSAFDAGDDALGVEGGHVLLGEAGEGGAGKIRAEETLPGSRVEDAVLHVAHALDKLRPELLRGQGHGVPHGVFIRRRPHERYACALRKEGADGCPHAIPLLRAPRVHRSRFEGSLHVLVLGNGLAVGDKVDHKIPEDPEQRREVLRQICLGVHGAGAVAHGRCRVCAHAHVLRELGNEVQAINGRLVEDAHGVEDKEGREQQAESKHLSVVCFVLLHGRESLCVQQHKACTRRQGLGGNAHVDTARARLRGGADLERLLCSGGVDDAVEEKRLACAIHARDSSHDHGLSDLAQQIRAFLAHAPALVAAVMADERRHHRRARHFPRRG